MTYTEEQLHCILENHEKWLDGDGGCRADFREADLTGADLSGVDLSEANFALATLNRVNLAGAVLTNANFLGASFEEANLEKADFSSACLAGALFEKSVLTETDFGFSHLDDARIFRSNCIKAVFLKADLRGAILVKADFNKADFTEADLRYAHIKESTFRGAFMNSVDLREAHLIGTKYLPKIVSAKLMACPEEGSFIGWKKCGIYIIKLLIPEDAKRSSATGRKCRASKVKVLDIQNLDGSDSGITEYWHDSHYGKGVIYKIGDYTFPDRFDSDRWNECSHGIHFFITREEAVKWK